MTFTVTSRTQDWTAVGAEPATGYFFMTLHAPTADVDGLVTTATSWRFPIVNGAGTTLVPSIPAGNALRVVSSIGGFPLDVWCADPGVAEVSLWELVTQWQVDPNTLEPLPGGQDAWDLFLASVTAARDVAVTASAVASAAAADAGGAASVAVGAASDADGSKEAAGQSAQQSADLHAQIVALVAGYTSQLENYTPRSLIGQANGIAELDDSGKVLASRLPSAVLQLDGVWDPVTNTPPLSDATGHRGHAWIVNGDATRDLGSGPIDFGLGDWLVYGSRARWEKADNSDAVQSVAGKRGAVVLSTADIHGAENIDNTSDALKPISLAVAAALAATAVGGTIVGRVLQLTLAGGQTLSAGTVVPLLTGGAATTLDPDAPVQFSIDTTNPLAPVLSLGVPRGHDSVVPGPKGDPGDLTGSALVPVSASPLALPNTWPITRVYLLGLNVTVSAPGTPDAARAGTMSLVFKQPAAGGPYTVTFPAGIVWAGGVAAPTMPTTANAEMHVDLRWTGQGLRGIFVGNFFP